MANQTLGHSIKTCDLMRLHWILILLMLLIKHLDHNGIKIDPTFWLIDPYVDRLLNRREAAHLDYLNKKTQKHCMVECAHGVRVDCTKLKTYFLSVVL